MTEQKYEETNQLNLQQIQGNKIEYTREDAIILAMIMEILEYNVNITEYYEENYVNTYNLCQGIIKIGVKGVQAAKAEVGQLHSRNCFQPVHMHNLTSIQRRKVLESLIFLT